MNDRKLRAIQRHPEDRRPTEINAQKNEDPLGATREQLILGSTIADMLRNSEHALSAPLAELMARAQKDLPTASIDPRASLLLEHQFQFEKRVGYRLQLKLFDAQTRCVQVCAEVDQDGRHPPRLSHLQADHHLRSAARSTNKDPW